MSKGLPVNSAVVCSMGPMLSVVHDGYTVNQDSRSGADTNER